MEDDLNFFLNGKWHNKMENDQKKWKTTYKKMEDDLKQNNKKGRRPQKKWKTTKSTKINLIGCDTIVNLPSLNYGWNVLVLPYYIHIYTQKYLFVLKKLITWTMLNYNTLWWNGRQRGGGGATLIIIMISHIMIN